MFTFYMPVFGFALYWHELYETIKNLSLFLKELAFSLGDTISLYRLVIDFSKCLVSLILVQTTDK